MLAAGGDPRRELSLADRAVAVLADDLESASVPAGLARTLTDLRSEAAGLPRVSAALDQLLADAPLACRWLALVVLLDELSDSDPSME